MFQNIYHRNPGGIPLLIIPGLNQVANAPRALKIIAWIKGVWDQMQCFLKLFWPVSFFQGHFEDWCYQENISISPVFFKWRWELKHREGNSLKPKLHNHLLAKWGLEPRFSTCIFFFFMGGGAGRPVLQALWDLSFPTKDWTWAHSSESMES